MLSGRIEPEDDSHMIYDADGSRASGSTRQTTYNSAADLDRRMDSRGTGPSWPPVLPLLDLELGHDRSRYTIVT